MELKVVVIVAVAVVVRLASSAVISEEVEYSFGALSDFIKELQNDTYHFSPEVTISCLQKKNAKFNSISRSLTDLTTKAKQKFDKYFKNSNITDAMKKYSKSFSVLPTTLWAPLEKLEYNKSLQAIDVAGKTEYDTYDLVYGYAAGNETATVKVFVQFEKITYSKLRKTRKLTIALKLCMGKGNTKFLTMEDV